MLTNFIREAADQLGQSAITVPEPTIQNGEAAIRINRRIDPQLDPAKGIYDRARVIYYRARRQGMTRAASIF